MISLLAFLAFLEHADNPGLPEAARLSVRAEAMASVTASELRASALLDAGREWNVAHEPSWPAPGPGSRTAPAPLFPTYHPEEWISLVANQLHLADRPITRAALHLASLPVRVDLGADRLYVAYRFSF